MYLQKDSLVARWFPQAATLPQADGVRVAHLEEELDITIFVRREPYSVPVRNQQQIVNAPLPHRRYLSREAFDRTHGASERDLRRVMTFARLYGLRVVEFNALHRRVLLRGTVQRIAQAFLVPHCSDPGVALGNLAPWSLLHLPPELAEVVDCVQEPDTAWFARLSCSERLVAFSRESFV